MNIARKGYLKSVFAILIGSLLSACSFFGDGEVDLDAPVELESYTAQFELTKAWSYKLGKGPGDIHPISVPAIDGDRLFAADRTGSISAISLSSGKALWKREIKNAYISGATGASDGLVLVGTSKGQVIALNQENGETLWSSTLSSEILAPPATNGDTVVAVTLDGKVHGLDAVDGSDRWLVDTSLPLLTLRGNSAPVVARELTINNGISFDVVFVGHDNGKISAYSMVDGVMIWEARVGIPEGTTDLERMVDIDGKPLYFNGTVYAVSFQGGVMAIQPSTGRSIWYQELSSTNGAGGYGGTVAVADDRGIVKAFNASEGTELWSTDEYENRSLNAPAVSSEYVAVADFEGYLHLLSRRNGETIGRKKVDGSGVRSPTIIHNDQIIILDNSGGVSAFNVNQR